MPDSQFVIHAEGLKTDYTIFGEATASAERRPLLLALDGDDQFAAVRKIAGNLTLAGKLRALHVVGIGYGGGYRSPKNRRARDYTPTRDAQEPLETGRAEAFLQFISEQLIPTLGRHYDFPSDDVGITGHSLSALFGVYALLQRSAVFRRYLVSSPSIWWDQRSVLASGKPGKVFPTPRVRAYLSVGKKDSPSMSSDLVLLDKQLMAQPIPGLEYIVEIFPTKDHHTAWPVALTEGLPWLYSAASP
jgi:predicted alpha/beta superfamily hydrolase